VDFLKAVALKIMKVDPYCLAAAKMLGVDSKSSWQSYKVYADIRGGSQIFM